jgi:adenosylcobinamide-phosphate synthase
MNLELQIMLALILDSVAGDPPWMPHPVKMIGRLAAGCETACRSVVRSERAAGVIAVLAVLGVIGLAAWGVLRLGYAMHPWAGEAVSVLMFYFCFAARDLVDRSSAVHAALDNADLPEARKTVAMIVGRDTGNLDESGVIRACVESVAENTVDGVTAPLFWAIIGGPLGAVMYKAVNTLDSIFGHTNEQYFLFGRAAARLDDAANFLPARITGLVTILAAMILRLRWKDAWRIFQRDRLRHPSPNGGHVEAAVAGAMGIRLGGDGIYLGKAVRKPFIGDPIQKVEAGHILQVNRIMIAVTALFLLGMLLLRGAIFLLAGV